MTTRTSPSPVKPEYPALEPEEGPVGTMGAGAAEAPEVGGCGEVSFCRIWAWILRRRITRRRSRNAATTRRMIPKRMPTTMPIIWPGERARDLVGGIGISVGVGEEEGVVIGSIDSIVSAGSVGELVISVVVVEGGAVVAVDDDIDADEDVDPVEALLVVDISVLEIVDIKVPVPVVEGFPDAELDVLPMTDVTAGPEGALEAEGRNTVVVTNIVVIAFGAISVVE